MKIENNIGPLNYTQEQIINRKKLFTIDDKI